MLSTPRATACRATLTLFLSQGSPFVLTVLLVLLDEEQSDSHADGVVVRQCVQPISA